MPAELSKGKARGVDARGPSVGGGGMQIAGAGGKDAAVREAGCSKGGATKMKKPIKRVSMSLDLSASEDESISTESIASLSLVREAEKRRVRGSDERERGGRGAGGWENERDALDVQVSGYTGTSFTYTSGEDSDNE